MSFLVRSCYRFLSTRKRTGASPCAVTPGGAVLAAPIRALLLLVLLLVLVPAPSSALTADGVLLLAFKYSVLSDPLSVLSSWNYDDATPCAWNGVACAGVPGGSSSNDTSRVVSLVLPRARLLGSIPSDLGLIQHLRHLDLSGNSLNGSLPSTLFFPNSSTSDVAASSSSELRVLSLASNEISGDLPDLPAGALTNLQVLNLSDNALIGRLPSRLALLPNLTVLSLSGNYLSGSLPGGGGGFSRAEYVDLSSNLFNGTLPPDFAAGGGVRYMNLSYNRLAGDIPAAFAAKFTASAAVDLSFNNLTGEIPASGPLSDQKPRAFAGNPALCGRPLKVLCPIPSTLSDPPHNATDANAPTETEGGNSPPAFAAIPKTVDGATPGGGGGSSSQQSNGQRGLKPAAIVGIIAGDLGGIGLLFVVFLYVYQAKKKKQGPEQQQQAGRGIGPGKAGNLAVGNLQQLATKPSTLATTSHNGSGGNGLTSMCLGRKAGGASDESEETSTGSDTEADDAGKAKEAAKSQQRQQQGGVLVTVDGGETELELETLLKASAYILGASGSSIVYKAVLADGTALAVRRVGESGGAVDKLRDFEAQVRGIAKLRHPNILAIRGFYWGADEKLLIYDYAPNGSLANISHKKLGSSPYHLPWESRLRIARGVARGLAYLHEKKCVHGNVKPSNILLGDDMDAMLGDFGLERLTSGDSGKPGFSARHFGSKRSSQSQGSLQEASATAAAAANASPCATSSASPYHAPESLKNLKPSPKWDVYAFGVVLLELLAGQVFSEAEFCQWNAGFAAEERNRTLRMADPAIRGEVEGMEEALLSCFRLGFSCSAVAPQRRPSMKEASQLLDRIPSPPFSSSLPA
uniref:Putative LRR receptor-like serine/threonine-protein kinase At4g37250 n=1 Tax=Anthurium amnicola TaxID=1678845 RepID=A0A1D1YWF7_9ARAE